MYLDAPLKDRHTSKASCTAGLSGSLWWHASCDCKFIVTQFLPHRQVDFGLSISLCSNCGCAIHDLWPRVSYFISLVLVFLIWKIEVIGIISLGEHLTKWQISLAWCLEYRKLSINGGFYHTFRLWSSACLLDFYKINSIPLPCETYKYLKIFLMLVSVSSGFHRFVSVPQVGGSAQGSAERQRAGRTASYSQVCTPLLAIDS